VDDGLMIVNVADPANPAELGRLDTPGSAKDVTVQGGFAYVADGAMGFRIIDIENPAAPAQVGFVDTPGDAQDIALADGFAFVADGGGGLRIITVANPAAPAEIGSYGVAPGHISDVATQGDYAYLAGFYDGLSVVDISDPAHPAQVGRVALPGYARSVAVAGGIAYVACQPHETGYAQTGGMSIVGVLDPANPVLLGHFPIARPGAYEVALKGSIAFIAAAEQGVHIVDVSDPARPEAVGVYDTQNARGIAVSGDFACVADTGSLKILDITDPARPVLFKTLDVPAEVVTVSGDLLFAAYGSTVRMIYLSTPECTRQIAEYTVGAGTIVGISVTGDYVFLAVLEEGVRVLRVSDSYTLSQVAAYDMLAWPNGVAVSGADNPPSPLYVHVATARLGLNILSFVPRAQEPTPTPRLTPTPHPPTRYQYFYPFVLHGQYPAPLCGP
jgi:hypothetical protein